MASDIDPSKPAGPIAYTSDVRGNFATAKAEIEALQQNLGDFEGGGPYLALSGGDLDGPLATSTVGFNDTAPIAKPTVTGLIGGNAALASLLAALSSYGLITNSTWEAAPSMDFSTSANSGYVALITGF